MKAFPIAAAAILASTFSANAMHWVTANQSCSAVCEATPVRTGIWKNNSNLVFFVCKANVNNTGDRPGYNLAAAYGDKKCVVPYNGKELAVSPFECLCKDN